MHPAPFQKHHSSTFIKFHQFKKPKSRKPVRIWQ